MLTAPAAAEVFTSPGAPGSVLRVKKSLVSDTEPVGVRLGGFILYPGVQLQTTYNDNIYSTNANRKSDLVTSVKPALALQTNWRRHSLFLGAEGDFGSYKNNSRPDYADYGLLMSGQYDFTYETYLIAAVGRQQRHQDTYSIADPDGSRPRDYTSTLESLSFTRALGRMKLFLSGKNEDLTMDTESGTPSGGGSFDERSDETYQATLSYAFTPGSEIFTTGTLTRNEFSLPGSVVRKSKGSDVRVGYNFDPASIYQLSLYGGYLQHDFDSGNADRSDFYFGGKLTWKPTALTLVSLTYDKAFRPGTVSAVAGVVNTTRRIDAQHKLTPLLTLSGVYGYDDNDYVGGSGPSNRDTRLEYRGVGVKYDFSNSIGLRLDYNQRKRTSNLASDEFDDNRVLFSLVYMK